MLTTAGSTVAIGYALQYFTARTHLPPPDTATLSTRATPTSGTINALSLTVPLYTYRGHKGTVTALSWSPNGHWIASAGVLDQTVQVWDAATGEPTIINAPVSDDNGDVGPRLPRSMPMLATFSTAPERVDTLAWASDSVRLASALGNNAVSWSPDGKYIASASSDRTVQVWEATTGNRVLTYRLHPAAVNTVAWSPDGQHIASAGQDGIVQVWSPQAIQAGQEDETESHLAPLSIVRYAGHGGAAVNNLAWSPDGAYIASAGEDITVQLWHSLTAGHIFTYAQHSKGGAQGSLQGVTSVTWSPNSKYIASGAYDGTVQLWNACPVPAP